MPPKYFSNPNTSKVYIAKQENSKLPMIELTKEEEHRYLIANPSGIILNPPGAGLTNLFEKTLKTNFTSVDLEFLQQKMPKLLIDDLEICQNFEMRIEENRIYVKITNSLITANSIPEENQYENSTLISLLTSAIACTLAKTTGKPIRAQNLRSRNAGKDLTIEYNILNEVLP